LIVINEKRQLQCRLHP